MMFIKRLITYGIMGLGSVMTGMLYWKLGMPGVFIGEAVVVLGFIWGWATLRCPFCRRRLPLRGCLFMEFCPYCGEAL